MSVLGPFGVAGRPSPRPINHPGRAAGARPSRVPGSQRDKSLWVSAATERDRDSPQSLGADSDGQSASWGVPCPPAQGRETTGSQPARRADLPGAGRASWEAVSREAARTTWPGSPAPGPLGSSAFKPATRWVPQRLRGPPGAPGCWAYMDGARPRLASQVAVGKGGARARARGGPFRLCLLLAPPSPRAWPARPVTPAPSLPPSGPGPPAPPGPPSAGRCIRAGDGAAGSAPLAPLLAFLTRRRGDRVGRRSGKFSLLPLFFELQGRGFARSWSLSLLLTLFAWEETSPPTLPVLPRPLASLPRLRMSQTILYAVSLSPTPRSPPRGFT